MCLGEYTIVSLIWMDLVRSWRGAGGGVPPKPIQFPLRCGHNLIVQMLTMQMQRMLSP